MSETNNFYIYTMYKNDSHPLNTVLLIKPLKEANNSQKMYAI